MIRVHAERSRGPRAMLVGRGEPLARVGTTEANEGGAELRREEQIAQQLAVAGAAAAGDQAAQRDEVQRAKRSAGAGVVAVKHPGGQAAERVVATRGDEDVWHASAPGLPVPGVR